MRYRRAVEKLRTLAEECDSVKGWPPEEPFLLEAYVFGDMLRGADPLERVEVVLVLNLPSEDVPWESHPRGAMWLADRLRLDKGGFAYWWRSHLDPVCNHRIQEPVRFWSPEGPSEGVLQALAERRFGDLPRLAVPPDVGGEQLAAELEAALGHLRAVHAAYWDRDWRRDHRGLGRYPEDHLWEAVHGYLDVHDAAASSD
jgi:hypothetical protein